MRVTVNTLRDMKGREKIAMLTAYDAPFARALDAAGVDTILVGDSMGNVVLGYENTLPVTMDAMVHHTAAVCRATRRAFVILDLPFMSYQPSVAEGVRNAGRALKETGCQGVKLEGGREYAPVVKAIADAGIPVVGHVGLTPQSVHRMGGYHVQGRDEKTARRILEDAQIVEEAGASMIVLECVPWPLAKKITETLEVPTIGIGAGPHCDGQVLVIHDMLNFTGQSAAKFVKLYMDMEKQVTDAARNYVKDVRSGAFPTLDHAYGAADAKAMNLGSKRSGRRGK